MNTFRSTARVVGTIYLLGFIVGLGGNGLIQSLVRSPNHLSTLVANSMLFGFGALLWLMAVVGDVAHGVLMFPLLKLHGERIAIGYLAFRIIDAVFIGIMVVLLLLQLPLANEYISSSANTSFLQVLSTVSLQGSLYAYDIGMSALGIAGLLLNYLFYKAKLVPRFWAVWGLLGYAVILCGMLSELLGSGFGLVSSIPGGLWEAFFGVWLITKGFSQPAFTSQNSTARPSKKK